MENLYSILQISSNASNKEIKIAYKKLVLKYHPDKNIGNDTNEQFKKIQYAYQILSDEEKRKEYDEMNNTDKEIFNELFMNFIKGAKNVLFAYMKASLNIKNNNIIDNNDDEYIDSVLSCDNNELDIIVNLEIDLIEKYLGKKKKIKYTHQKNIGGKYEFIEEYIMIELNSNQYIYYDMGDEEDGKKGNLIINIITKNKKNYRIDGDDIIKIVKISLYEYLYGIEFILDHFNENINIEIKNPINDLIHKNKELYYKIDGMGLKGKEKKGDLYINFKLQIKNIGTMEDEELLKYYYPPITK
jgi:curved DNA-binding protein